MLFNSYVFIAGFLPVVLAGFYILSSRFGPTAAMGWLLIASLFFYGWWNPPYLLLIAGSIVGNFGLARAISARPGAATGKWLLALGIAANLFLLGYFKYAGFFIETANAAFDVSRPVPAIFLPLAISFFTFQQIAFLVDLYRREIEAPPALEYGLFVSFFPQLIAGPIVLLREVLPQFRQIGTASPAAANLSIGGTIFAIGLIKKVVIADGMAASVDQMFGGAAAGVVPTFVEAWVGTVAFGFQIYFDFSGYSDMAIGLARMFGIRLPINFHSPYKAASIIDFWRCWHITLSRFLRDYLYVPLGGSRRGPYRRHLNLMIVMLLGGLWHGAGWTFVLWGGLHGLYLLVNHAWRAWRPAPGEASFSGPRRLAMQLLTFTAVSVAWVPFRAADVEATINIWRGMFATGGISLPRSLRPLLGDAANLFEAAGAQFDGMFGRTLEVPPIDLPFYLIIAVTVCWLLPNTQQFMAAFSPGLTSPHAPAVESGKLRWQPSLGWAALVGTVLTVGIYNLMAPVRFIYFQF
jgi:D-alanyl-lipoteichoic acid acyltransferase DltB (MBOAT superfamily)